MTHKLFEFTHGFLFFVFPLGVLCCYLWHYLLLFHTHLRAKIKAYRYSLFFNSSRFCFSFCFQPFFLDTLKTKERFRDDYNNGAIFLCVKQEK